MNENREPTAADYLARAARLESIAADHARQAEEYLDRARKDRAKARRLDAEARQ